MEQIQEIKKIRDVEVAAPVAMIGYAALGVNLKDIDIKDIGIYRFKNTIISSNGVRDEISGGTTYLKIILILRIGWSYPIRQASTRSLANH